jgi:hypothetical protein
MKLIIREYLESLKERGELDAILPDLLSALGLNVFSRPARGSRQYGVDVGAVGKLEGDVERVYLFTVKPGNLTRSEWDSGPQAVRPSLNEIIDVYVPTHLPSEHRDKPIVICLCIGGEVVQQLQATVAQFEAAAVDHSAGRIQFKQWNGDKLAELIQAHFLREDLLPAGAKERLRKAIALLEEPEASYRQFTGLVRSFRESAKTKPATRAAALRRLSMCLWIMFAWAREERNLEAAYKAAEVSLLYGWEIAKGAFPKKSKRAADIRSAFVMLTNAYLTVSFEYLKVVILPYVETRHALSFAVVGSNSVDANLKLFDVLGRLATAGLWANWLRDVSNRGEIGSANEEPGAVRAAAAAVRSLITNNPTLFLPVTDDQAIDISIALALLGADGTSIEFMKSWLLQMLRRAELTYRSHGRYPCDNRSYSDLIAHPRASTDVYRQSVTNGSVLYPLLGVWAAILDDDALLEEVSRFKRESLRHCNFQLWYPSKDSEEHLYINSELHGVMLSDVGVGRSKAELLAEVFGECDKAPYCKKLSALKYGWLPIVVIACRHHRLPLPMCLLNLTRDSSRESVGSVASGPT